MLAVIVMHVKNAVSSSSSNFDEAHETGRSDFIFLMCFSCAEKSEDGKKDIRKREIWLVRDYSQWRKTALILWSASCRDNEDRRKDEGAAEKGNIEEGFKSNEHKC